MPANPSQPARPSEGTRPAFSPELVAKIAAECDRVAELWEPVAECIEDAKASLARVGPIHSPQQDTAGLYYPLLFLVKRLEEYEADGTPAARVLDVPSPPTWPLPGFAEKLRRIAARLAGRDPLGRSWACGMACDCPTPRDCYGRAAPPAHAPAEAPQRCPACAAYDGKIDDPAFMEQMHREQHGHIAAAPLSVVGAPPDDHASYLELQTRGFKACKAFAESRREGSVVGAPGEAALELLDMVQQAQRLMGKVQTENLEPHAGIIGQVEGLLSALASRLRAPVLGAGEQTLTVGEVDLLHSLARDLRDYVASGKLSPRAAYGYADDLSELAETRGPK